MAKKIKKLLFVTIFLAMLFLSSAYVSVMPIVNAAEPTVQEETLSVLREVVGLKTELYTITQSSQRDSRYIGLAQKEADLHFESPQGKLRVSCSFVNNSLRRIYISDSIGSLYLNQPTANALDMARDFLNRYQNYTGDSFYGELESMLNTIDISENATKTIGDIKLEVSVTSQTRVMFIWTYTSEGVSAASKKVFLSYDNGVLKSFLDNWQLYSIGSEPRLSSDEALAIALNASKTFSWNVDTENGTIVVSDFHIVSNKTVLNYLNYMEQSSARGNDPFTLYP